MPSPLITQRAGLQHLQPVVQINHGPPGEDREGEEIHDRDRCQKEPQDGILPEADRSPRHNRADNASENEQRQKLQEYGHALFP